MLIEITPTNHTMSQYEFFSLGIAVFAAMISLCAVFIAGKANGLNKSMFRRQRVIDLHTAWQDIKEIDGANLVGPDIVKAANALALTSSLWNHDIVEKSILYQTYWEPYKTLYEQLNGIDKLVPGKNKTCKSLLTTEIQKAYRDMETISLDQVLHTRL